MGHLGELIDRSERLVVFAEDEGPPPGWYHHAFEHMQDTPYQFSQPDDFTCAHNRGGPDASLLLMNHWVSRQNAAPDRATAVGVNGHDVIVERARACQRERGLMPELHRRRLLQPWRPHRGRRHPQRRRLSFEIAETAASSRPASRPPMVTGSAGASWSLWWSSSWLLSLCWWSSSNS